MDWISGYLFDDTRAFEVRYFIPLDIDSLLWGVFCIKYPL